MYGTLELRPGAFQPLNEGDVRGHVDLSVLAVVFVCVARLRVGAKNRDVCHGPQCVRGTYVPSHTRPNHNTSATAHCSPTARHPVTQYASTAAATSHNVPRSSVAGGHA